MIRLASLTILAAVATLPAQTTTKVVPAGRAKTEGSLSSLAPWGLIGGRVQQVFDGAAIARATATIRSFAHRRDGRLRIGLRGRRIRSLKVTLGYTSMTPATLTTSFARNRTGAQTVVFNGSFVLPNQGPGRGVGPFNILIRLAQPFVYARSKGNLLVEIEIPGKTTNRLFVYIVDADLGGAASKVRKFGTPGPFRTRDIYDAGSDPNRLVPGGTMVLSAQGLKKAYPAAAAFGFSNRRWGSFRLPLDLTPAGAAGNHLYVSLDLLLVLTLKRTGTTFSGAAGLPIPNLPALGGKTMFGQAIFFDPASNAFRLVFSNGVAMTVASAQPSPIHMIWAKDSAAATGIPLVRRGLAGLVTQFTGVFR